MTKSPYELRFEIFKYIKSLNLSSKRTKEALEQVQLYVDDGVYQNEIIEEDHLYEFFKQLHLAYDFKNPVQRFKFPRNINVSDSLIKLAQEYENVYYSNIDSIVSFEAGITYIFDNVFWNIDLEKLTGKNIKVI